MGKTMWARTPNLDGDFEDYDDWSDDDPDDDDDTPPGVMRVWISMGYSFGDDPDDDWDNDEDDWDAPALDDGSAQERG